MRLRGFAFCTTFQKKLLSPFPVRNKFALFQSRTFVTAEVLQWKTKFVRLSKPISCKSVLPLLINRLAVLTSCCHENTRERKHIFTFWNRGKKANKESRARNFLRGKNKFDSQVLFHAIAKVTFDKSRNLSLVLLVSLQIYRIVSSLSQVQCQKILSRRFVLDLKFLQFAKLTPWANEEADTGAIYVSFVFSR